MSSYASALLRLGFEDEDIRQIEPNSIAVFQLPEGDEVAEALPPAEADEAFPPQAPRLVKKLAVFEFDLRQHKTDTKDWKAAFQRAVQRRAGAWAFTCVQMLKLLRTFLAVLVRERSCRCIDR